MFKHNFLWHLTQQYQYAALDKQYLICLPWLYVLAYLWRQIVLIVKCSNFGFDNPKRSSQLYMTNSTYLSTQEVLEYSLQYALIFHIQKLSWKTWLSGSSTIRSKMWCIFTLYKVRSSSFLISMLLTKLIYDFSQTAFK